MKIITVFLTVLALVTVLFAGCAGSDTTSPTTEQIMPETAPSQPSSPESSTGKLTVLVTDAPNYEVTSVVVHFSEVWVHKSADGEDGDAGWIPLTITGGSFEPGEDNEPGWVDLAQLRDDEAKLVLAQGDIDVGTYTQLRLIMYKSDDKGVTVTYIPDPEDLDGSGEPKTETVEAKLPSGELKFVRPFEVAQDGDTQLLLDFDLQRSVIFTGASQSEDVKVIVKPVVKLQVTPPESGDNEEVLYLYEKDPDGVDDIPDNGDDWSIVNDGASGKLKYNLSGETFDFDFIGKGLEANTSFTLIYYADPWPGDNPGAWIASGNSNDNGIIKLNGPVDLNTDLPNPDDDNYVSPVNGQDPPGAKIWLVLSADYNNNLAETGPMTGWNPTEYLFEGNTITYDDTGWEPPEP
jgi:hypothetical protein